MPDDSAANIEKELIEVLRLKDSEPQEAKKLIADAKRVTGADEWDVRKVLWRLTADGLADFTPGFKKVSLRKS